MAVVRGKETDFIQRHPYASDCGLLIEVADTSLPKARAKTAMDAAAGVSEYWIVNLIDRRLDRFQHSDGSDWHEQSLVAFDDSIELEFDDSSDPTKVAVLFSTIAGCAHGFISVRLA